ncbi:MAG TPA: hypothetical protein VKB26_02560 [Candidatus Acidoferrales bacterium]|nr:hypothetical protein [Candidatus Acidoferrales bacterium]
MEPFSIAIGLGVVIGAVLSAVVIGYLAGTRAYRQARRFWALGLGYVLVAGGTIGALLLLFRACGSFQIKPYGGAAYCAIYSFAFSYACGLVVAYRSEARWRKSASLD